MEGSTLLCAFNNIYFAIFALFCFKLLIKISLALLTHFYIVKGNRKEAARIAEEIYGIAPELQTNLITLGELRETPYGNYICHALQGGSWADRSPLHEAAFQGRLLSLKTLIAQGFNVNIVTIDRVSALHEACLGGHVACAKVLLENGAHVNAATVDGVTPLFKACCSGSAACVNMLLEFGARPHLENHFASPIHEAVKRGHRECMEILLANGVDVDQEDPQLGTSLYVACVNQRTDCVKKLLELGANVDLGKQLDTPLHAAARKSSVEIVNLLTDYGASLTCRNSEFKCALDLAAPNSSVEQALLLREGMPIAYSRQSPDCAAHPCLNGAALEYGEEMSFNIVTSLPGPASLAQLCRLCIRKSLGRSCLYVVHKLCLPEPLENFLLFR